MTIHDICCKNSQTNEQTNKQKQKENKYRQTHTNQFYIYAVIGFIKGNIFIVLYYLRLHRLSPSIYSVVY